MINKSNLGLVQIYWGNGKGKTTSALGTALRACGNGYSVYLIQFLKNGADSLSQQIPGEIMALKKFDNFNFKRFGVGEWYIEGKNIDLHKNNAKQALLEVSRSLENNKFDIIIADEILYAVQLGLLNEDDIIELIKSKPKNKELILTGSHKPFDKLFKFADLITEVKKIKHPYDNGKLARKGLDF